MYETVRGVPQNDVTAYMWVNLASSRSNGEFRETAVQGHDEIAERLTCDRLAKGQRLP